MVSRCYTLNNLKLWIDRGAVCKITPADNGTDFRAEGKGFTAEESQSAVSDALGCQEKILRTVTFCGVLSFVG